MPKKIIKQEVTPEALEVIKTHVENLSVQPITETFGNADLNTLKDKINEIIRAI